ncbi:MAG: ABC transporter ATP-binding protein [Actinomycetota bacterium]|nr:ABC transporter ATP-binding protein [Actinomycetota bacterium]MDK1026371.1 ABC transporter ATP-binding protein [Actinomycetota bacterium]MDK1038561.1 ABC transporter ATP-binding protein [Actinomycetota bacterium]MDK1097214.1 ABC transporter ATP-binding protein [Actinomycetota bacterium]MDK1102890.1 ABC transporter ATP-binding protein [Actinomycetota bacterium]
MTDQPTPAFTRVLFRMIRQQPVRYGFALFLWVTIWTIPILIGLITAHFFDALTDEIPVTTLTMLVGAVLVYAVVRSMFIFMAMRNHASLLFRAAATMRRNLLVRIYELPGAAGLRETPGENVSRFRDDVEHIVEPFDLFVDFVGALVSGLIAFGIMLTIDPVITSVVAIPVLIVAIVSNRTGGLVRRYRKQARDATEAITGFLGETFAATQAVKVAGAEAHMLRHFQDLNDVRKTMMVRDRTLTAVLEAVFRNTVNIGTGLILLLAAGRLAATGAAGISLGEFALFVFLLHLVTDSAYFYGMFIARVKQGSVSVERLTSTMSGEPWERLVDRTELGLDTEPTGLTREVEKPGPFESLSIRDLSYHYPGSTNGIDGVDLDIALGEFVVLTGRIGSGKTTLLRAILGLLPAEGGTIEWNGEPVDDPATWLIPPRVAYTSQVPRLFSMSLEDNLVLGAKLSDDELAESIHIATMRHDIELMPDGLETLVGPRGVRLSGGQVQRSAAARMFTRAPQLLVLDDVSSALDVETEQTLWRRLFEARSDVAALVVSHRHSALARADRVVVMEKGRVVAVGTAEQLAETSEAFQAIWEGVVGGG